MAIELNVNIEKRLESFDLKVDFRVEPGLSVFFGDSGAGKTLTLRMITGLMRPDRGRVTLDQRVLFDQEKRVWVPPRFRRIGLLFQHESVFPHLTVRENVLFGGRELKGVERQDRASALMRKLRLEKLADRSPAEISGGQKQRVVLARTLMQRPEALLLDEPFSSLDLISRRRMRECLAQVMRETTIPVILVTHDLVEALTLADRLFVLHEGRIVQQGTPKEVVDHPVDDHVKALVDPENLRVDLFAAEDPATADRVQST